MLDFFSSSQFLWYNSQGRLHGGLRSSDQPVILGDGLLLTMIRRVDRHRFGWMRSWYCTSLGKQLRGRRRGSFILWSQCSGILSVRSCPVSWANFPEGDRLTAAEELFRDSGSVQMSCSRLSRSAEFCSAFPQCLHVAPRVSIPWDRSLLLRAQVARAVLDQPFRQRDCVPVFGN